MKITFNASDENPQECEITFTNGEQIIIKDRVPQCRECGERDALTFYDQGIEREGRCAVCFMRERVTAFYEAASALSDRWGEMLGAHNAYSSGAERFDAPAWLPQSFDEFTAEIAGWVGDSLARKSAAIA